MKLHRDGSEPRRGVFRIEHDDGHVGPVERLGIARQKIRQHAEDESRREYQETEQARRAIREGE